MADKICDDSVFGFGRDSAIYLSPCTVNEYETGAVLELWEEVGENGEEDKTHIYLNQQALGKLILALAEYVKAV